MKKNTTRHLEATTKLNKKNKELLQQLQEAKGSIAAIKAGNIDALVVADKKNLKVYTEKTADKTYRILIEKMHEGAVTVNEGGVILYCNSSFAKMVSLPLQQIIGTKFQQFVHDSSKKYFGTLLAQEKKNHAKKEIRLYTGNNREVPVLMSANVFLLDSKRVLSIILTDLTIQKKYQEELELRTKELEQKNIALENANKDLTSFTHVSSHDLQEPLRKIQTFVNLIAGEEQGNLSDKGKDYFRRIQETARRMQALIEDLLDYSRKRSGERKFEVMDLSKMMEEIKGNLEETMREKSATIINAPLGAVTVIPYQFRQLMHNLVGNSLKFSKPGEPVLINIKSEIVKGGKLKIKKTLLTARGLSTKIDYYHLVYSDNGIGFDSHLKDRIFEVFQRLHSKEAYPGTGMGLAICKRVVENHNGIITATGKLNKGARFDIYIPVSQNKIPGE